MLSLVLFEWYFISQTKIFNYYYRSAKTVKDKDLMFSSAGLMATVQDGIKGKQMRQLKVMALHGFSGLIHFYKTYIRTCELLNWVIFKCSCTQIQSS